MSYVCPCSYPIDSKPHFIGFAFICNACIQRAIKNRANPRRNKKAIGNKKKFANQAWEFDFTKPLKKGKTHVKLPSRFSINSAATMARNHAIFVKNSADMEEYMRWMASENELPLSSDPSKVVYSKLDFFLVALKRITF